MSNEQDRWLETGRLAELGLMSSELVHELRQPLFAVKAMAQLLSRRLDAREERAQVDALIEQLGNMESLLDRYSVTGRRPGARLQPVPLAPPVEAGVALLQHRARASNKLLEMVVGPDDTDIDGDPVAIQQITANLVANALDAARGRVDVRVDGVELQVRDDGPGIPSDLRQRIFEPFFSTKPPGRGTGLGLSIAHHLVCTAGGTMRCDSCCEGTVFVVRFREAAPARAAVGQTG